jgi:DNA-binding transcriptional LysR family regulator
MRRDELPSLGELPEKPAGAIPSRHLGLGFVLEGRVEAELTDGRLVRVLDDWCPPFAGYHLYYPSRRQPSAAFALLVEALRYRG